MTKQFTGGVAAPPFLPVALLLALSLVLGAAGVAQASADPPGPSHSGADEAEEPQPTSLLVKFRDDVDPRTVPQVLDQVGALSEERVPDLGVYEVEVPSRVEQAAADLAASPLVEYAEPNSAMRLFNVEPNDPLWAEQWGAKLVDAPSAWAATTGRSHVTVAVLDTGVDASHPDLDGALVRGYNAFTNSGDADDDHGHGTQVAGIVAARGNNAKGIAGMCWRCRIMPVKVLDEFGAGDVGTVAEGIVWAADHRADVINLSLGGEQSRTVARAILYAQDRGAIVIAAAGNNGSTTRTYPAAEASVIGVGGSTPDDRRYFWSNYGSWVSVAAPVCATSTDLGGGYDELCGTSASAPLVAGIAALMRSVSADVTASKVMRTLEETGKPLDWVRGGRVDAGAALRDLRLAKGMIYPLTGDWNGDGTATPGWFDDGRVYLRNRNSAGRADLEYSFGRAGDIPIVGDWNGDGRDTVGVIRGRWWYLRNAHRGGKADISFVYGRLNAGDYPLAGDWNRDGRDTVGVVRRGEWHLRNVNRGGRADVVFVYGRVRRGDVPLVGDWNRDGRDTPGIVRGSEWHLRHVNRGGRADQVFRYGRASDTPVVGDWNGNGRTTVGVVRGSTWHLRNRNSAGPAHRDFPF